MELLAIVAGFAVCAIVGMTGVGGGSLMTPLLIGVFRLSPAVAVGTDLCFAGLTKAGGWSAHARQGHVERRLVWLMLAGSVPAALGTIGSLPGIWLGASLTRWLPERWVRGLLGAALVTAGIRVLS